MKENIEELKRLLYRNELSQYGKRKLLQKANLTEEQKDKYLTYIQSESKRISDMYKKLLLLSYKKNWRNRSNIQLISRKRASKKL